jgi:hypothetical protein
MRTLSSTEQSSESIFMVSAALTGTTWCVLRSYSGPAVTRRI